MSLEKQNKYKNKKNIVRYEIGQIIKNRRLKLNLRISWVIIMVLIEDEIKKII
jgi:hypothetical protein